MKAETAEGKVLKILKDLHSAPIRLLQFVPQFECVMSTDDNGLIEFWDSETFGMSLLSNDLNFRLP